MFALGCGTTPIDAVVQDDTGYPGMSGAGGVMTANCSEPGAGRFILQAVNGCLRHGEPTTVFTEPAFTTELTEDCSSTRAQWDLTPAGAGTFTIRNVDSELSLDVRAASEFPGTPLILYDPNTLDNQRFFARARFLDVYELSPRHASHLCWEARGTTVEIWPCSGQEPAQNFRFLRRTCP